MKSDPGSCYTTIGVIVGIPLIVVGIILLVSWRQQKLREKIKEAAKEFGEEFLKYQKQVHPFLPLKKFKL